MTIRSAFTALPFEAFDAPGPLDSPDLRARLLARARLTRFLLDLARRTVPDALS